MPLGERDQCQLTSGGYVVVFERRGHFDAGLDRLG